MLVYLGVDETSIEVRGLGAKHPERVGDLGENGEVLPGLAEKNRAVLFKITSALGADWVREA